MQAVTATPMRTPFDIRTARRPMSLHVAMLAQRREIKDDPLPTDVMVYHQPLSDVPVPAAWRQSGPAPVDGTDIAPEDDEDGKAPESNAAGAATWHRERRTQPRRIASRRAHSMGSRLSALLLGSAVTCTLVGWVSLI